ncbi:hypothetical protein ES703_10871 [subsurface metagenome]
MVVVQLGGPLQQAAVQVKYVTGVGFPPRRAAQQERHLPVGHGVLAEVIVNHQGVHALVAEIFADGGPGIRGDELQWRRFGSTCCYHHSILHCARVLQLSNGGGHRGGLLSDSHVNAVDRRVRLVGGLLVDDSVQGNGRLAGLAVADNELPLAAADGGHAVDGLEARLQGLFHRQPGDDIRRLAFDGHRLLRLNVPAPVNRLAQGAHYPAQHGLANADLHHLSCATGQVALTHQLALAKEHQSDVVLLQVQRHAEHVMGKLHQLRGHHVVQSVDPGNAVTHHDHLAHLGHIQLNLKGVELFFQQFRDFCSIKLYSHKISAPLISGQRSAISQ